MVLSSHSNSLSELPECQMPIAVRGDIIDQILAIALHPVYDWYTAQISVETILNLTQSPKTHTYIVRREVIENMLEICEQRCKMINQQLSQIQPGEEEEANVLKYVTITSFFFLCPVSKWGAGWVDVSQGI